MSLSWPPEPAVVGCADRLAVKFGELEQLAGQRNAIDGRIVEIVAEIDRENMWGKTGCRSISALVAWKLGLSSRNAQTITAVADRLEELPRCTAALREGQLSLDQVGVIAERAGAGSDEHYAALASVATVDQLRSAIKLEPRPEPERNHGSGRSVTKTSDETFTTWRIRLPHAEAATFDAALSSHQEALVADWKRDQGTDEQDHTDGERRKEGLLDARPPVPNAADAFMSLVTAGWDAEVARRAHGQRTTVIVHLDVDTRAAQLHLGPLLTDADRRYFLCDATCEVWFERDGQPIGAGRTTRTINRRLRRALEYRNPTCAVPGCGATHGLHAHHIVHWEDGGPTELFNLVLLCPYHHRLHHRGIITITGPAPDITVTDSDGQPLSPGSLARPPTTPPPDVPPCRGPLGERADWWWYTPFEPKAPPDLN